MQQVKRAALAPRDPSDADRAIAATADAQITAARRDQTAPEADADAPVDVSTTSSQRDRNNVVAGAAASEAFGAYSGAAAYAQA
jgi:hypothetical protein